MSSRPRTDAGAYARADALGARFGSPAAAVLVLAGAVAVTPLLVAGAHLLPADLEVYRAAAGGVYHGSALYDRIPAGHTTGFTYPPFAAIVLSPLVPLTSTAGYVILNILGIACAVRCSVILGREAARRSGERMGARTAALLVLAIVLLMAPTEETLRIGQISLVILWLVTEDLLGSVPASRRGYLIGLACGIKLVPLLFIAVMVVTGRYDQARRAIAVFAASIAIGVAVDPAASWRCWSHLGAPTDVGSKLRSWNQSLSGVLERTVGEHGGWLAFLVIAAGLAALTLYACRRLLHAQLELEAVALTWVAIVLISPVSWDHYYVWLLPAFALMVGASARRPILLAILVPSVLVMTQRPFFDVPHGGDQEAGWHGLQLVAGNAYAIVAALVFIWLVRLAFSATPTNDSPADGAGAGP